MFYALHFFSGMYHYKEGVTADWVMGELTRLALCPSGISKAISAWYQALSDKSEAPALSLCGDRKKVRASRVNGMARITVRLLFASFQKLKSKKVDFSFNHCLAEIEAVLTLSDLQLHLIFHSSNK